MPRLMRQNSNYQTTSNKHKYFTGGNIESGNWQKEVLAAEGLPTEADELTDSQLKSIQRIYEMITYLN